jgi:predicted nucleic acid-binding protein
MYINPSKCTDIDYIDFFIAASNIFSCTEASRYYPNVANAPYHDAFTRCLQRKTPDTEVLWDEVKNHVKRKKGRSKRAHIMFSLRAFLRLELQRVKNGISWFESTMKIRRVAVTAYLNNPLYTVN